MVLGYYTSPTGDKMPCPNIVSPSVITAEKAIATTYTTSSNITLGVYGATADATPYNIVVEYFVLINSVLEV
jgi:hypothetical protein